MLALQALAAHAACAQLQSLLHAAEHMNALALVYTRRRAQRTPAHAMSHERADTYVVAFKVERPVTRQANGGARGLECALLRERDATVAARAASHANILAAELVQTRPST